LLVMKPPLLTIDEAARYLKVSKTSLRRWTTQGRLGCVRVGGRGERRFRADDLDRFLNDTSAPPPASAQALRGRTQAAHPSARASGDPLTALAQAAMRNVPRHVALHYHDREELWRLFRPYVQHHLAHQAPILWVHEAGHRAQT